MGLSFLRFGSNEVFPEVCHGGKNWEPTQGIACIIHQQTLEFPQTIHYTGLWYSDRGGTHTRWRFRRQITKTKTSVWTRMGHDWREQEVVARVVNAFVCIVPVYNHCVLCGVCGVNCSAADSGSGYRVVRLSAGGARSLWIGLGGPPLNQCRKNSRTS